jgi:diguanylate cyclase (GGDEF)-like protein
MTRTEGPSVAYLQKRLAREKVARETAELLLESKSRALYEANQKLAQTNEQLDVLVQERTSALLAEKEKALGTAQHLMTTLERLELVLTATRALSWTYDITNRQFQRVHGDEKILSIDTGHWISIDALSDYVHPHDVDHFRSAFFGDIEACSKIEFRLRLRTSRGDYRWFSLNACMPDSDQHLPLLVGSLIDIHEQAVREEQAWTLANIDSLTQVANRYYFEHLFFEATREILKKGSAFSLVLIDINEFKLLNERFGQHTADQALRRLAQLLQEQFGNVAKIARLAADEFILLCADHISLPQVFDITQRFIKSVDHFILAENERVAITLSAGVACFPEHGHSLDELLQAAQTANQQGKQSRYSEPSSVLYHAGLDAERQRHRLVRHCLESAVMNDEFSFALEPLVSPEGRWLGAEALLRWENAPESCSTQEFILVAESCGLIFPIGEWVIRHGIQKLQELRAGYPDFGLSINISAAQFQHQDIALLIEQAGASISCDLSHLTIEVTESLFLDDIKRVRTSLNRIKDLGCRIAVDDFGSGYSSLSYVQQLPIDYIKIDKSFTDQIKESNSSENIVRAIIDMGHSIGSKIIAEGVENQWQVDRLKALHCDALQGYFFARPMNTPTFLTALAQHHS